MSLQLWSVSNHSHLLETGIQLGAQGCCLIHKSGVGNYFPHLLFSVCCQMRRMDSLETSSEKFLCFCSFTVSMKMKKCIPYKVFEVKDCKKKQRVHSFLVSS